MILSINKKIYKSNNKMNILFILAVIIITSILASIIISALSINSLQNDKYDLKKLQEINLYYDWTLLTLNITNLIISSIYFYLSK